MFSDGAFIWNISSLYMCITMVFFFLQAIDPHSIKLDYVNYFVFTNYSIHTVLFIRGIFQSVCFHVWFLWTATFRRSCLGMYLLSKWTQKMFVIFRRWDALLCVKKTFTGNTCVHFLGTYKCECIVHCTWRKILAVRNYERHLQTAWPR